MEALASARAAVCVPAHGLLARRWTRMRDKALPRRALAVPAARRGRPGRTGGLTSLHPSRRLRSAAAATAARALEHTFCDLGMSPLANSYRHRPKTDGDGAVLSAARLRVRHLLPGAAAGVRESREDIFSDYAYFSSYSQSWLAHAEAYADAMTERLGLGAAQPGRRDRQQRRLPAAVLRRAGSPGARASSRPRTSRASRRRRAFRHAVAFFGADTARHAARRRRARRSAPRQQRARARARASTTSSRG